MMGREPAFAIPHSLIRRLWQTEPRALALLCRHGYTAAVGDRGYNCSLITDQREQGRYCGGVGRRCGIGRGLGVALGVELGVGLGVGGGVAVGVTVGVGVGVGPVWKSISTLSAPSIHVPRLG